jgi:GT2 family glycosyltransferase
MSPPDVSVIVVSYNTREVTLGCLRSIFERSRGCSYEVIVVDNASSDGSAEALREAFPQAVVIASPENVGFARANNVGLAKATGSCLLLLNPDTEVFERTLADTLAHLRAHPEVGLIGCRSFGADGVQQSTLFRYPTLPAVLVNVLFPGRIMRRSRILGRSRYVGESLDEIRDVDVVAGCFMFLRREVYEQVGGMDEDYFMYGEEVEWCYRIHRAGWRIRYFPGASILHYGGVSSDLFPSECNLALATGQLLTLQKIRGPFVAWVANLCMLLRDLPRVCAWSLLRRLEWAPDSPFAGAMRRTVDRWSVHVRGLARWNWSQWG